MNALVRTTVAFTQMEGSSARNVIPPQATMVANMRLNPSDSVRSALDYLKKVVDDPNVEVTALESFEPSRISQVNCPAWDKVASAVASTWPGCIVSPYLMVQCSEEVTALESFEPSRISQVNCPAWDKVASAVASTWPGCIVSPYLMVQCSDSRHYGKLSDHVYRFSAMDLTAEERATIHGNNERIRTETACKAVEFFIRLMKQC